MPLYVTIFWQDIELHLSRYGYQLNDDIKHSFILYPHMENLPLSLLELCLKDKCVGTRTEKILSSWGKNLSSKNLIKLVWRGHHAVKTASAHVKRLLT